MFFDLKNGKILEELEIQNPLFLPDGSIQNPSGRPSRVSYFEHGTYKLDIAGFNLNRTDEDLFTDKYEMMNVFQIHTAMDSLEKRSKKPKKHSRKIAVRSLSVSMIKLFTTIQIQD